jgi:spermidine synthase
MQGLHLTADLYDCRCDGKLLTDANRLAELCRQAVESAQLTIVDEKYVQFPDYGGEPGGVTGAVLLAESHLAVHSWPERRSVTLDVYVCNFSTDNSTKAEHALDRLLEAFDPGSRVIERLLRGIDDPLARPREPARAATVAGTSGKNTESDARSGEAGTSSSVVGAHGHGLLLEWLNADSAYGFRASRRIESVRTPWQKLEVFDTPQWGRLFRLDGCFMTSERDEFFYHEPIVHPAAIAHDRPASALVIGGGDGGSAEELLKHPTVQRVIIAELDSEVIRMSREHLQAVHRGALDDPRVEVRVGDGWETAAALAKQGDRFDLVVLDLTDPDTPAHRLYTREFFALAADLIDHGGLLTLHIGAPAYKPDLVRRLLSDLGGIFRFVRPLGVHVPLYGTYWGMAVASNHIDPLKLSPEQVGRRITSRGLAGLRYYNEQIHHALFALPTFYRELLA